MYRLRKIGIDSVRVELRGLLLSSSKSNLRPLYLLAVICIIFVYNATRKSPQRPSYAHCWCLASARLSCRGHADTRCISGPVHAH